MNPELLPASFDPQGVTLSFVVALVGSFAALTVAPRAVRSRGKVSKFNALMSGIALGGVGIWSMHFLGMLAYKLPIAVRYGWPELIGSLLAAVAVSAVAVGYIASEFSWKRLFVAGPLAGVGVAVMHYLGMAGIEFGGYFVWDFSLVALSVVIAIVAATAALWVAFSVRTLGHRLAGSGVMAAAVCAMHYTGMAAASAVCTAESRLYVARRGLGANDLSPIITIIAVGAVVMILVDTAVQSMHARQTHAAS